MLVFNSLSITCLIISWNISSNCKRREKAHYHLNRVQSFILFFLKDINQLRERKKENRERKEKSDAGGGRGGREKGKEKVKPYPKTCGVEGKMMSAVHVTPDFLLGGSEVSNPC